ncbi:MAG: hypothetical protein ACI4BD_03575 [Paludibacteraceae bacterium]
MCIHVVRMRWRQSAIKEQPKEESKSIPMSSVVLKGKHANLFKGEGDSCKVSLVQANGDWQVRVKMTIANKKSYNQLSDKSKYKRELGSITGELINASDVELTSLDISTGDWDMLVAEEAGAQQVMSMKTYTYHHYTYEKAKEIYDNVAGIELSNIELDEKEKSDTMESIYDDDTRQAIEDAQQILEAEGEMLNALQKLL